MPLYMEHDAPDNVKYLWISGWSSTFVLPLSAEQMTMKNIWVVVWMSYAGFALDGELF